ncbi:hypothetical protein [Hymenobacter cavernae]|uniref:DUF3575 domain-containing protein n=1 Tax=Hymenobacter cavernae TaxID=2044852 RepID=A0ABQ1TXK1_9BACT|nr:hypothetical protein [Hymenobacter cavernae]GGF05372.1 hypothetical protein GCM10011383_15630 [Hymenobacter cavernae]
MKLYLSGAALLAVLTRALPSQAQTAPAEVAAAPIMDPPTSHRALVKLGLGLDRGLAYNGYSGLIVPVTLGVERPLTSAFSFYGNFTAAFRLVRTIRYCYPQPAPLIRRSIIAVGGRYYYNQASRIRHGHGTGSFSGNYLTLQASTDVNPIFRYASLERYIYYDFSALSALWGMQRPLGSLFVYDLNAGVGLANNGRFLTYDTRTSSYYLDRRLALLPELSLRLSVIR